MEDKLKMIRATILEKNGIPISPKDPIMVVYTMMEILEEQLKTGQTELLNEFRSQIEETTHNWKVSIQQQSEPDIETFLNQNQDKLRAIISKILHETENQANRQIEQACAQLSSKLNDLSNVIDTAVNQKIKETRNAAWLNLVASALVMLAVLILVLKFTF